MQAQTVERLAHFIRQAGPEKKANLLDLLALLVRNPENDLYIKAIIGELMPKEKNNAIPDLGNVKRA